MVPYEVNRMFLDVFIFEDPTAVVSLSFIPKESTNHISKAWCKTTVTYHIKQGRYNSYAPNPQYVLYPLLASGGDLLSVTLLLATSVI